MARKEQREPFRTASPRAATGSRFVTPGHALQLKLAPAAEKPGLHAGTGIGPVLDVLRERSSVDFDRYRPETLQQRIARRIVLHKLQSLDEYVRLLRSSRAEAEALCRDVLVNATSFFRDPEAFEALKAHVFPAIAAGRLRRNPVRIWTIGCSTGEEAYSLAIAFDEFCATVGRAIPLQVFATEVDGARIAQARAASYGRSAVQELSAERLRRYFVETGGRYQVAQPIRDRCVFVHGDALSHPPLREIDLVSCRNLLVYLSAEWRQRLLSVAHCALRDPGFLWLEPCETVGTRRELFEPMPAPCTIFLRKSVEAGVKQDAHAGRLSRERVATRGHLQSVIEQQGAATAAFQAASDDLRLSNETLRRSNAELEGAYEAVQSANAELTRINDTLWSHNAELTARNNDLAELLACVPPVLVFGRDLRLRRFTPAAERLLGLRSADVGRRASEIDWGVGAPDLAAHILQVIASGEARESVVSDTHGESHRLRIGAHHAAGGDTQSGVVIIVELEAFDPAGSKSRASRP